MTVNLIQNFTLNFMSPHLHKTIDAKKIFQRNRAQGDNFTTFFPNNLIYFLIHPPSVVMLMKKKRENLPA